MRPYTQSNDLMHFQSDQNESEATLRAFYDNSPVLMGITELVGNDIFHIYDNPATCSFFNVAPGTTAAKFAKADLGADPAAVGIWIENYRVARDTGTPVRFEYIHDSANGPRRLSVSVGVIRSTDSGRTRFCYVAEDVTERHIAQESLRRSEERFRLLVSHSANIIWRTDPKGSYLGPQKSFERFTGLSYEEYRDDGGLKAVHPEDLDHVIAQWGDALKRETPFEFEYRLRNVDGEYRHTFTRGVPMRDANGTVTEWIGYAEDISDRKIVEQQKADLLRSENEARRQAETLNELAQTLAAELDIETLVQKVTDAATRLSGAEFGAFFYNVLNDEGEAYQLYTLSGAPRSAFEKFPMPRNTPIFGPTFSGDGVVRIDDVLQDPRYGTMAPYHGMPEGHLPVRSYLAAPVISRSGEVIGGLFFGHERVGVFGEKDERMLVGLAAHAAIAMDNARLYADAHREIRRRQVAEAELRSSQEHLQMTTETAQVGTWEWQLPDNHLIWSPIHKQLWGYSADATLIFSDWSRVIHREDLDSAEKAIQNCLNGSVDLYDIEYRITPIGSSETRWMRSVGGTVREDGGEIVAMRGVTYDITAEHASREALLESRDLLEIKVNERTEQLQTLTAELRQEVAERTAAEAKVRQILSKMVDIQEEERRRIGRNIHDHLGQQLTALRINLSSLAVSGMTESDLRERTERLQHIAQGIDSSIDAVTWELRPGDIETEGLDTALNNLVDGWSRFFDIPAEYTSIGKSRDLPDDVEVNLYRIAQEALHNIYKHAGATSAGVIFEQREHSARLVIEDDGVGFDIGGGPRGDERSLGLVSMHERADLIGATLEIESHKGSGTTIIVRVPLDIKDA